MRITTKAVFDIESWALLDWEGFDYLGPVDLCGGGQANSGQASEAANNANAASQQNLALSNEAGSRYNQLMTQFFGSGALGSKGTLSGFLDPNSMNVTTPTGAYKLNYQQTVNQTENEAKGNQANIIRQAANNGLSLSSPAVAEMARQTGLDTANLKGQDFASAVTAQHNDAMQNFWNASNIGAGGAATGIQSGVAGASGAGQTAANIYGTAGQYHPSPVTSIIGAGLQAGGQVGAAAACPAEGSLIRTPKGDRLIEHLRCGDEISQLGNVARLKCDPVPHDDAPLVKVETNEGLCVLVSESHSFARPDWGYFNAYEAMMGRWNSVKTTGMKPDRIKSAVPVGRGRVFELITVEGEGNHTYCANGLWSLE
jgi:hypothetical protein